MKLWGAKQEYESLTGIIRPMTFSSHWSDAQNTELLSNLSDAESFLMKDLFLQATAINSSLPNECALCKN